jgi:hypothetical protein
MHRFIIAAAAAATLATVPVAMAQHDHAGGGGQPHDGATPPAASDGREFVRMPDPVAERMLANMRDHLQALQDINDQLGLGHLDAAARIAEQRLGMSSLGPHGAQEVAGFMPKGMQGAGSDMHRAASRFAIVATDAGVSGDMRPVFSALGTLTSACVACHAGYRVR